MERAAANAATFVPGGSIAASTAGVGSGSTAPAPAPAPALAPALAPAPATLGGVSGFDGKEDEWGAIATSGAGSSAGAGAEGVGAITKGVAETSIEGGDEEVVASRRLRLFCECFPSCQ
jgi:hypothetical protein